LQSYEAFCESADQYRHNDDIPSNFFYAVGLCEEAGEVAGKVKKLYRDCTDPDVFREALMHEIGDVFWYATRLANYNGISIEEVVVANMRKLQSRMDRGKLGGSGDGR
jgi:NTP pyrophosphatase (non-canonical NTP hydrolase)